MDAPEHPGNPQWQTFEEWNTMKPHSSIEIIKTAKEKQEEDMERFGLQQEDGSGWGDASEAQDAGWGLSSTADSSGWN